MSCSTGKTVVAAAGVDISVSSTRERGSALNQITACPRAIRSPFLRGVGTVTGWPFRRVPFLLPASRTR